MSEIQRLETFPVQPKACSPEEQKLIEATGELGKELTNAIFQRVPDRIPSQRFRSGLEELLGKDPRIGNLVSNSTFRQETYKNIDRGMTKALEDGIKKGADLKPILDAFSKTGIISESDASLSLFIATYEAGIAKKSINAWSNQVLGTNLQANTPVTYNGKKMTYYNAYLEVIKGMTQAQMSELKKKCTA